MSRAIPGAGKDLDMYRIFLAAVFHGLRLLLGTLLIILGAGAACGGADYDAMVDGLDSTLIDNFVPFTPRQPEETDAIIVRYRADSPVEERSLLEAAEGLTLKRRIASLGVAVYDVDPDDTGSEVVQRLKARRYEDIAAVEIDMKFWPAYAGLDPKYSSEWHLPKIGVPTAWETTSGDGVTAALLDTGTNCDHPDLAANCVTGWNAVDGSSDASDLAGHGTATAGTLASVGDNEIGGVGVAYGTKLMPIRIAVDSSGATTCSAIASAITHAADHGARVASNSYYVIGCSVVNDAARYMSGKGGVYVRAAGNDNTQLTEANDENIVIVSATDVNDVKTSWSNYGSTVDIAAPGTPIYCTLVNGSYGTCWGTSFSVPIVSGTLALMFAANPDLTALQARSLLFSTALDLGASGWDPIYGHGRVDAAGAVEAALQAADGGFRDTEPPSVPQGLTASSLSATQVSLRWSASSDDVQVTGYDVARDGVVIATTASTAFTDAGLAPSTSYAYTVAARDAAGNVSAPCAPLSVTTPEAPFEIVANAVTSKTTTSAVVTVVTSAPSTLTIKYGKSTRALTLTATSDALDTGHDVLLDGLSAKTKYYYVVTATSDSGETAVSPLLNFRTPTR